MKRIAWALLFLILVAVCLGLPIGLMVYTARHGG